jgi:hypothetical protein
MALFVLAECRKKAKSKGPSKRACGQGLACLCGGGAEGWRSAKLLSLAIFVVLKSVSTSDYGRSCSWTGVRRPEVGIGTGDFGAAFERGRWRWVFRVNGEAGFSA